jgi:alpha-tubulin suppressor-like RCC1 family protein
MGISSNTRQNAPCPKRVLFPAGVKITQISTRLWTSVALSSTGDVYQWGDVGTSWTAAGEPVAHHYNKPVKVKVPSGTRFTWVSAGFASFKARGADGKMYAWGNNDDCQFGQPNSDQIFHPTPTVVSAPSGVTFARASGDGGLAVSTSRAAYVWGENHYGELGNGLRDTSTTSDGECAPASQLALPAGSVVTQAVTGWDVRGVTAFAVTADGAAYGWGENRGFLGDGLKVAYRLHPTRLKLPSSVKVVQIAAVADAFNGARAALALTSSGRIYGWGLGQSGLIGGRPDSKGSFQNHPTPVLVG